MGLRTPSKIVGQKAYLPYYIRYVTHGGGIKYSNIEKNLNSKGIFPAQGYTKVFYLGLISSDYLFRYPNIPKGSEYNLISKLPKELLVLIILETKIYLERNKLKEGVYLTLFIYQFK